MVIASNECKGRSMIDSRQGRIEVSAASIIDKNGAFAATSGINGFINVDDLND